MLLTFGIFSALLSIFNLIGVFRYNYCIVLFYSIFMSINSIVIIILTFKRAQLIPVLIMVLLTTGSAFLFANTLRNIDTVSRKKFIAVNLNPV
jgi:hypothetical protein